MTTINASEAFTNSVRAAEITNANITKMVFSQTLQTENTLMAFVQPWAVSSTQNFVTKDFPSSFTRDEKQWGIDDAALKYTKYERYSFNLTNYHHTAAWDTTDTIDKAFDPIARLTTQLRYAEERLISRTCLRGLIEPINMVSPDPTADGGTTLTGGTGYIAAKIAVKRMARANVWYDKATAVSTADGKTAATTSAYGDAYHPIDTYAHIRHQFRLREVTMPLAIAATPFLMRTLDLWKGDSTFRYGRHASGGQVVSPLEANKYNDLGGLASFMWQGFRHVVVFESALPQPADFGDPDNSNQPFLAKQVAASNATDLDIPMRDLSQRDQSRRVAQFELPATGALTATLANANPINLYTDGKDAITAFAAKTYIEVKTRVPWLTYVWCPASLMFAYAPSLFIRNKMDTVIRLKDARFLLTRLCLGAVVPDSDHYMLVALRVQPSEV